MPHPDMKQRIANLLFPSILLIFVALYVTSLASGSAPEVGLLRSGVAGVVLAVLGRVALGIISDEETLAINELALLEQQAAADGGDALGEGLTGLAAAGDPPSGEAPAAPDSETNPGFTPGFTPTPLGTRAGAATVESLVRSGQLGGKE